MNYTKYNFLGSNYKVPASHLKDAILFPLFIGRLLIYGLSKVKLLETVSLLFSTSINLRVKESNF